MFRQIWGHTTPCAQFQVDLERIGCADLVSASRLQGVLPPLPSQRLPPGPPRTSGPPDLFVEVEARHQDGERLGRLLDRAERATPPGAVDVAKTVGTLQRRKDLDQRLFSSGVGGICGLGVGSVGGRGSWWISSPMGWALGNRSAFSRRLVQFKDATDFCSIDSCSHTPQTDLAVRTKLVAVGGNLGGCGSKKPPDSASSAPGSAPGSLIARRLGPSRLFLGEHAVRSRCEAVPWCPWRITSGMMRREGDIGRCENIYSLI